MTPSVPSVVVGAGQAGLGISRHLQQRGIDHVVFERGRIGETWRTQRWDSFRVNTPNMLNRLPNATFPGGPDAFPSATELVGFFADYARRFGLPVHEGVTVTAVEGTTTGFVVRTDHADFAEVRAGSVVLACGAQHRAKIPPLAAQIPRRVVQVHAAAYRNPGALPPGAVLVVGSAQSGCQIAEDLLDSGRRVYLSVSRVARAPRRYRGRDVLDWLDEVGFLDVRPVDLPDPAMQFAPQPQVSGVGPRGHTVGLQDLASRGAILVGRLTGVTGSTVTLDDSVADAVRFGDAGSAQIKQMIEEFIARAGITVPPLEDDPADEPCADPGALAGPPTVDLAAAGITSIVWCTGFGGDLSWIRLPVTDDRGAPVHTDGIPQVPGLFFLGLPWLRTRRSGIIAGIDSDAAFIAEAVVAHLAGR